MSISLVFDGDPEGCQSSATSLRDLATTLDDAGTVAASVRTRSATDWNSNAGDRLRSLCTRHVESSERLRGACSDLALRLSALGSALAQVRAELDRARKVARSGGYNVTDTLPSFEQALPDGRAETALDHALAIVARARVAETEAHADFALAVPPILAALAPPPEPEQSPEPEEEKSALGRLGDLLPDVDLPDLSGLPDLPGVGRPTVPEIQLPDFSRLAQLADKLPDLPFLDQVRGLDTADGLRVGGALAGLALCTRAKLPPSVVAACTDGGAQAGEWAAGKLKEGSDEQ